MAPTVLILKLSGRSLTQDAKEWDQLCISPILQSHEELPSQEVSAFDLQFELYSSHLIFGFHTIDRDKEQPRCSLAPLLFVMITKYNILVGQRSRVFNFSFSFFMEMGPSHKVWIQTQHWAFSELRVVWIWASGTGLSLNATLTALPDTVLVL